MQINVTCPNCSEQLTIHISEGAPTKQEYKPNNYADVIDLICAKGWEHVLRTKMQ